VLRLVTIGWRVLAVGIWLVGFGQGGFQLAWLADWVSAGGFGPVGFGLLSFSRWVSAGA
jgi:hypothetical protein